MGALKNASRGRATEHRTLYYRAPDHLPIRHITQPLLATWPSDIAASHIASQTHEDPTPLHRITSQQITSPHMRGHRVPSRCITWTITQHKKSPQSKKFRYLASFVCVCAPCLANCCPFCIRICISHHGTTEGSFAQKTRFGGFALVGGLVRVSRQSLWLRNFCVWNFHYRLARRDLYIQYFLCLDL